MAYKIKTAEQHLIGRRAIHFLSETAGIITKATMDPDSDLDCHQSIELDNRFRFLRKHYFWIEDEPGPSGKLFEEHKDKYFKQTI